jgi:hypothetical protein
MNIDMNSCMGNLSQMITTNSSQKNIVGLTVTSKFILSQLGEEGTKDYG